MLQTQEARKMTRPERLRMLRVGVEPSTYNRPARAVIKPFSKKAGVELGRLALKLTNKILEKEATA